MQVQHIIHPIPPTYDSKSRILVLGSFPSIKSRQMMYFYGHPQNRFWKVLARLFDEALPATVSARRDFLLRNRIAAWDVIGECDIAGSADSSIRNVRPNDLSIILETADIAQIFTNGKKAHEMYHRFSEPSVGRPAVCLPSTSPANAAWSLDRLVEAWSVIKDHG